ncbi:MAG: hypothetical protein HY867_03390 [Chloroflexi bacterium]|nr:hypothetical protein [Chloroflexota bacterium]
MPNNTNRRAISGTLGILFFVMIIIGSDLSQTNPGLLIISATILLALGAPTFIYGFSTQKKYQMVFDYEPTEFWGKPSTGMRVRNTLTVFSILGLWGLGTGIAYIILWF